MDPSYDLLGLVDKMRQPPKPVRPIDRDDEQEELRYLLKLLDYELKLAELSHIPFIQLDDTVSKLDQLKSAIRNGYELSDEAKGENLLERFQEDEEFVQQPSPERARSKSPSRSPSRKEKKPRINARKPSPVKQGPTRRGVSAVPLYSRRKIDMPKICKDLVWNCEDDNMYVANKRNQCTCTHYREAPEDEYCPGASKCSPSQAMVVDLGQAAQLGLEKCTCYTPKSITAKKSEQKALQRQKKKEKLANIEKDRGLQLALMAPGEREAFLQEEREELEAKRKAEKEEREVKKLLKGSPRKKSPPRYREVEEQEEEEQPEESVDIRYDDIFKGMFKLDDHIQGGKRKSKRSKSRTRSRRSRRR
jgi:hypothetical protein